MKIERGIRVDLLRVSYECRARWRAGVSGGYRERFLKVGQIDDGSWFVELTGPGGDCRIYRSKQDAWTVIQHLMRAHDEQPWEQIPATERRLADGLTNSQDAARGSTSADRPHTQRHGGAGKHGGR